MPKNSGGLMQPLDPKVYEALLEVYEDKDYNLIVDYKNYTSTFVLKAVSYTHLTLPTKRSV